jgi:uncharacterized protein (DUF58 family)
VRSGLAGLAALTSRGRTLLAAGITALFCGIALGQVSLSRVGLLLVVLPVASAALIGLSRYQLSLVRVVEPRQVSAGQSAQVTLQISNAARALLGTVRLEDQVPWALGSRPRFVLGGLTRNWKREVSYTVRSDVRGRFVLGPMSVRVTDPFGLVELPRAFQTHADLIVTPTVTRLPTTSLSGAWTGTGDNRPRAFASGSAEDVTVREYRVGDPLRRVHWRSSARTGELMVRREEQPWQSRATVLLDNRLSAHRGHGAASSLEAAVSIAASIVVHLAERGFTVRLVTADGARAARSDAWHERTSGPDTTRLLEELAVVEGVRRPVLETNWVADTARTGMLIAVLGAVTEHDRAALHRMVHHTESPLALALDVDAWLTETTVDAAQSLRNLGWRAVAARPGASLPQLWQDLATAPVRRSS